MDIAPVALADGVHARTFKGAGLVVAHGGEKGLVLTDRNTAPIATVDVLISFAAHPTEARARAMLLFHTLASVLLRSRASLSPPRHFARVWCSDSICPCLSADVSVSVSAPRSAGG